MSGIGLFVDVVIGELRPIAGSQEFELLKKISAHPDIHLTTEFWLRGKLRRHELTEERKELFEELGFDLSAIESKLSSNQ